MSHTSDTQRYSSRGLHQLDGDYSVDGRHGTPHVRHQVVITGEEQLAVCINSEGPMTANSVGRRHMPGRTRSPLAHLAGMAAWTIFVLLAGCGKDSSGDEASSAVPVESASATTVRDACELVTAEDIAEIAGGPIVAWPAEPDHPDQSACLYGPQRSMAFFALTVQWRGGKEAWNAWTGGRELGGRLMQDPDVDVDLIGGDPVAAIGDAAHYGGLLPSLVLKGDTLLEFGISMLNNDRENFPVLAKIALSRL
jgi:hypothetical protein